MRLADTHCHLYFKNYQGDLDEVIDRARQAGVERILVPAIDLQSSKEVIGLIDRYDIVYGAVGVQPNSAASWDSRTILELKSLQTLCLNENQLTTLPESFGQLKSLRKLSL